MNLKTVLCAAAIGLIATTAIAQPSQDISKKRHPNLNAAQRFTDQAYKKIVEAQQANEFDLGGHAQKAKDLLDQANQELKQAAEVSNQQHRQGKP
jgi:hypothetical protein